MKRQEPSRREFLRTSAQLAAGLAAGAYLGPWLDAARAASAPESAVVGFASAPPASSVSATLAANLLESAIARATGASTGLEGLRRLVTPADTVGIKINCLAGPGLSTHRSLVDALIALLVEAGVPARQVIVWDRNDRDLARARYPVVRSGDGPYFFGTNDDFEKEPIDAGSVGGCLSRILTQRISALINVPVLKDHDLAGISGTLKSFYGAIHNPNKYHDHGCSPYIADLYAHPLVRNKLRLTVFDGLSAQFEGGPAYVPQYAWPLATVFASTDAVAADAIALKLIADKRRDVGLDSLEQAGRAPLWLGEASKRGLGVSDLARIREVRA